MRITGNASVEKLDFKLLESRIQDVDQASFGDLGLFGAEFLEHLLTDILQVGIMIPTMKGVVLRNPKLVHFQHRLLSIDVFFFFGEATDMSLFLFATVGLLRTTNS